MNKRTVIRTIAFLLLFAYILGLACLVLNTMPETPAGIQFKTLRAPGYINDGLYVEYINEYVNYFLLFIPIGIFFPFARGKNRLSLTLIFSIMMLTILECIKIMCYGGVVSIDDEIWMLGGCLTGYGFYSPVCSIAGLKDEFIDDKDGRAGWIAFAFMFAGMVMLLNYRSEEILHNDKRDEKPQQAVMTVPSDTVSVNSGAITNEQLYNRLYKELSGYSKRIVFTESSITPQLIFDEFIKVMEDHPELFWLTGGAKAETLVSEVSRTTIFLPELEDDPSVLPGMAQMLDNELDSYLLECPEGSEYDKALWVHDRIVNNTAFDSHTLFYAQSIEDDSHFDYAYTSYGALVLHKAVCAGYARAYQLIMNSMGIECGYVTGNAINSHGETESHAWNYIRLDGQYYFTDVTWDDPVNEDYEDSGRLNHDFFCLSGAEMGKDHFPDPDQFLPDCPETRSPY